MGVVHRFSGAAAQFRWEGVALEAYEHSSPRAVTKQVLIGPKEGAAHFAMRYFEVAPGRTSALDAHRHDHGVLVLKGRGLVRLGDRQHEIGGGDVIYIEPDEVHQFEAIGEEPLGFLCVIPPKQ
jgi:quercetin dioxygenase-like cupin family protein